MRMWYSLFNKERILIKGTWIRVHMYIVLHRWGWLKGLQSVCCVCMDDCLCLLKVVVLKLALGESHVVKEVGSGSSLS